MTRSQDLGLGAAAPIRTFGPLTRVDIARFAGAGGDFNPLHLDDEVAARAGFDGVIAMGQLQAAVLAGALSDWVGVEHVRRFAVRFASPFALGETLTVRAEVTGTSDGRAEVTVTGDVAGRIVATATAAVEA